MSSVNPQDPKAGASTNHHVGEADRVTSKVQGYYAKKMKEVAKWTAVRDQLLRAISTLQVPQPLHDTCSTCGETKRACGAMSRLWPPCKMV